MFKEFNNVKSWSGNLRVYGLTSDRLPTILITKRCICHMAEIRADVSLTVLYKITFIESY